MVVIIEKFTFLVDSCAESKAYFISSCLHIGGSPGLCALLTGCLSFLGLLTGWPRVWHRHSGVREAAGFLLVARPNRLLVDERSESGSRRNPLGDVVRRWKVLGGEQIRH